MDGLTPMGSDPYGGDGTEMLIIALGGEDVDLSTNSGASWVVSLRPTDNKFYNVTCSADGSKLTACYASLGIFVSTNCGATWNLSSAKTDGWTDASSVDGSRLVGAAYSEIGAPKSGAIYTSTDFGATWASNNAPVQGWVQVACSQDGTRLVAISHDTIYTALWPPALSVQPSGGTMVLSWPAPSTGFFLQQSVDLTPTNWVTVPMTPITSNYKKQVTLPLSPGAMFFRLAGPSF